MIEVELKRSREITDYKRETDSEDGLRENQSNYDTMPLTKLRARLTGVEFKAKIDTSKDTF